MKKFFGVAIAVVLLATVTFAAPAAKPKATGDADWFNAQGYDQQANATFNAISTKGVGWTPRAQRFTPTPTSPTPWTFSL